MHEVITLNLTLLTLLYEHKYIYLTFLLKNTILSRYRKSLDKSTIFKSCVSCQKKKDNKTYELHSVFS